MRSPPEELYPACRRLETNLHRRERMSGIDGPACTAWSNRPQQPDQSVGSVLTIRRSTRVWRLEYALETTSAAVGFEIHVLEFHIFRVWHMATYPSIMKTQPRFELGTRDVIQAAPSPTLSASIEFSRIFPAAITATSTSFCHSCDTSRVLREPIGGTTADLLVVSPKRSPFSIAISHRGNNETENF